MRVTDGLQSANSKHHKQTYSPKHDTQKGYGEDMSGGVAPRSSNSDSAGIGCGKDIFIPCKDIAVLREDADNNPGDDNNLRG